ncbi:Longitudinals lacking protein-like [Gryllus bimaculatus]|nr:Longitudinals lacking protein-like [Gryllus bimaculatus]
MAEPVLSVCWKNHTSELATEYKSLLENDFLVDCTLSAEGQQLKAHRLVLSACSPYFHMLFQEDSGKHPFVILLNASFETLKAVIDFVYQGETHIPERNLKAFLILAQSLQIKGLNAFTRDDKNKKQSSSPAPNVPQVSSENIQITSEVDGINASLGNYSQQHPHLSDSYSDSVQTNSSIPLAAYSASYENVRSGASMTHLVEHHRPLGCDEVFADSEVTVKHEPLYHVFPETRNKTPVNVKSYECGSGNFQREMDVGTTSVCGDEDLNIFSSCSESSHGNTELSLMPPAQEQRTQLSNEVPSERDVAERGESSQPESLMLKEEHLDAESDDLMDDRDMPVNHMTEADVGLESAYGEQNPDQCSSAAGLPPEKELATPRRRPPGQQSESPPPHTRLRSPQHFGEHSPASFDKGGLSSAHAGSYAGDTRRRGGTGAYSCEVCRKVFAFASQLVIHQRTHTGDRPFRCDVCGKAFAQSGNLVAHARRHTGERPFACDLCGKDFARAFNLALHKRRHH